MEGALRGAVLPARHRPRQRASDDLQPRLQLSASATEPPLGSRYCGNGVTQVWTELTVKQLLSMPVEEAALRLRESLRAFRHETVADHARWLRERQLEGCRTVQQFDAQALTFVVSSWNFDWEGVDFNAPAVCYDHAAHVPVVAVMVPRPKGDGLNVYASGTQAAMEQFASLMTDGHQ